MQVVEPYLEVKVGAVVVVGTPYVFRLLLSAAMLSLPTVMYDYVFAICCYSDRLDLFFGLSLWKTHV